MSASGTKAIRSNPAARLSASAGQAQPRANDLPPSGIDWSAAIAEAIGTAAAHGASVSLAEALRLAMVRQRVRRGELSEYIRTPPDAHLTFARWLVEHGRLSG
jgi:hypothetical protein